MPFNTKHLRTFYLIGFKVLVITGVLIAPPKLSSVLALKYLGAKAPFGLKAETKCPEKPSLCGYRAGQFCSQREIE